jgi:site-specific DNA-adenine methylase
MQYMGSKNRFAKELVPIIESYITSDTKGYLEPFVGGANMIDKIKFDKKYGCDLNEYLIELLKHIQTDISEVPDFILKDTYTDVKNNKENYPMWYQGLIGFCSFGNKFWNGYASNGKEDITGERTKSYFKSIKEQSPNLKGIIFKHRSFQEIKSNISGYVIYCDPPYRGTTKYKTDEFPYEEFYDWCRNMSKNNIVLISEYNMPDDFICIWEKETKANFDCNRKSDDDKNNRIEKLFILKGNL